MPGPSTTVSTLLPFGWPGGAPAHRPGSNVSRLPSATTPHWKRPAESAFRTTVSVIDSPGAKAPASQTLPRQLPWLTEIPTSSSRGGVRSWLKMIGSTRTSRAASGPKFVARAVYVSVSPTRAGPAGPVTSTPRSAVRDGGDVDAVSSAALLCGRGSFVLAETRASSRKGPGAGAYTSTVATAVARSWR
jgi:hypothetical protein